MMTVNQTVVLLDIYRGGFDPATHAGTVREDVACLRKRGLVRGDAFEQVYPVKE